MSWRRIPTHLEAMPQFQELHEISELFATLKQHFRTVRVHLAVLIDLQVGTLRLILSGLVQN